MRVVPDLIHFVSGYEYTISVRKVNFFLRSDYSSQTVSSTNDCYGLSPFQAMAFANDQFDQLNKEIRRQIESVDYDREMLGSIDLCVDVVENGVLKKD
jgi:hypothetical protein